MFRATLNTTGFEGLNLKIVVSHRAERVMIIILHSDLATSFNMKGSLWKRGLDTRDSFIYHHMF